MLLRPIVPADHAAASALWRRGWFDSHGHLLPADVAATRDDGFFAALLDRHGQDMTGGFVDDRLVALALVRDGDYIDQLHVAPDRRGGGFGGLMLAHLERRIAAAGHASARLSCAAGNRTARRFYERHGYVRTGDDWLGIVMADGQAFRLPLVELEKPLPASGPCERPSPA